MDRRSALLLVVLVSALVALVGASVYVSSAGNDSRPDTAISVVPEMPGATFAGFVGDEMTAGPTGTDRSNRWTSVVAAAQGWSQYNVAQLTTSYLVGGTSVSRQVAALPPRDYRFIFVSFTIDAARPADKLTPTAADSASRIMKQRYPGAEIIAVSPVAVDRASLKAAQTAGAILESSTTRAGGRYVDVGQPLVRDTPTRPAAPTDPSTQSRVASSILASLGRS